MAGLLAAATLVAGCAQSTDGRPESASQNAARPTATTSTAVAPSTTPAAAAPPDGASIDEVIAFIGAGTPADAATFHVAFRDGVTTRLGDDVAFTAPSGAPSGTTQCMTTPDGLTCLLDLTAPPPPPPDAEECGNRGGWISQVPSCASGRCAVIRGRSSPDQGLDCPAEVP